MLLKEPSSLCCLEVIFLSVEPLQGDKSVRVMRSLLAAQQTFVDRLVHLMKAVQRESGNRKKKVDLQACFLFMTEMSWYKILSVSTFLGLIDSYFMKFLPCNYSNRNTEKY